MSSNRTGNGHVNGNGVRPNGHHTGTDSPRETPTTPTATPHKGSSLLFPFTFVMYLIEYVLYPFRFFAASSLHHGNHSSGGVGKCPITGVVGEKHEWRAPITTDVRSVCPALNTLANHGYIYRDGKHLSALQIAYGLKVCYGLSTGLALFLSFGGTFLVRFHKLLFLPLLSDVNRHFDVPFAGVEHDASLVHVDTPRPTPPPTSSILDTFAKFFDKEVVRKEKYFAPEKVDMKLVDELIEDVGSGNRFSFWYSRRPANSKDKAAASSSASDSQPEDPRLISATSVARSRLRREAESPPLDPVHAEIARGEMGIILGVWERTDRDNPAIKGVPVQWIRDWMVDNRLPRGWSPDHVQKLLAVVAKAKAIRLEMERLRENPLKA